MIGAGLGIYASQADGESNILDYSPYNVWDSDHLDIVGTTTTALDYNEVGTTYDMVNPTAGAQPTYTASSANFNGNPSLTFDGSDNYLQNQVSDFRTGDTGGIIISVFRVLTGSRILEFMSSDDATGIIYMNDSSLTGNAYFWISRGTSGIRRFSSTTNIITGNPPTSIAVQNSGSEYKLFVNGSEDTINMINSSNDGAVWFDDVVGSDNITIGGRQTSAPAFSNIEWCFTGIFPYVNDATTLEILTILNNKYGI